MYSNKKVAFIDFSYQKGGTQRTLLNHILNFESVSGYIFARERSIFKEFKAELKEHGYTVFLASNNVPFERMKRLWKLKIPDFRQIYLNLSLLSFVQKRLTSETKVIVGSALFSNIYAYIIAKLNRKKFIAHLDDHDLISKKSLSIFKNADFIVTVSKFLKEEVVRMGIEDEKIKVIYPSIKRVPKMVKYENSKTPTIGFIGRITYEKGAHIFLDILKIKKNIKGVIAGEFSDSSSEYSKTLLQKMQELEREGRLLYIGYQKNIENVLSKINILIYPSLAKEGFGRTILESLYAGIPVIGSNMGAIPEVLNGIPYTISTQPNVKDFNEAVDNLLSQEIKPETIRKIALKKFPPGKSSKEYENLLLECLNSST